MVLKSDKTSYWEIFCLKYGYEHPFDTKWSDTMNKIGRYEFCWTSFHTLKRVLKCPLLLFPGEIKTSDPLDNPLRTNSTPYQSLLWNMIRLTRVPGASGYMAHMEHIWSSHQHVKLNTSPLENMAAIVQTIFSDTFLWMKSFAFWLKFHWSLFLRVKLSLTRHWFR